jgi:hypothetical protein
MKTSLWISCPNRIQATPRNTNLGWQKALTKSHSLLSPSLPRAPQNERALPPLDKELPENSDPPPIYSHTWKDRSSPTLGDIIQALIGAFWSTHEVHHRTTTHPSGLRVLQTQAPRSCHVSPAPKLPDALGSPSPSRWAFRLGFEAQTKKPSSGGFVAKPPNPMYTAWLTTPSVEPVKPFTSDAWTVYSVLPHSLIWPPPMHELHVHDFVLRFLHYAARTWSHRPQTTSNQAYLSLHHPEGHLGIDLSRLFFT